ncbi:hypothetical protein [Dyella sp. GSA-30]|uniref:hypothetical protein n=1 Tax=Dyella sp. GSA-30 TaxID=2994496 RepID=UPI002490C71A|nr:hypothetical protein [Dyella sp. GSA-30]
MIEQGWLPALCWHQVEELLQHQDDELVDARLRYLRSWPLTAWIKASDPDAGPGSVLDVLKAEVAVAYAQPHADALQVRELVRTNLFAFGRATEAIPDLFQNWRLLRTALVDRQESARKTAAISRWRPEKIESTRITDWMNKPLRDLGEAIRKLEHLQNNLANEIAARGDKRIVEPTAMAEAFFSEIIRSGQAISAEHALPPAIQILVNAGLEPDDIDLSATFTETLDRLIFYKRLRIVAEANGLPFPDLKRIVTRDRLPVSIVEESMRLHAHDQPERKGSDLNDVHLLCLAPYAHVTYVDKRTLESVRRARSKDFVFAKLIGQVSKASNYRNISTELTAL